MFKSLVRTTRCANTLLVIAFLTLCSAVGSVTAQGTSGMLPDPISSRDLDEYARRIGMSDQQLLAAETVHDMYKREFARLREGEIKTLMDNLQKIQERSGGGMPTRKAMEDVTRTLRKLNDRIAAVDRGFFDQLQPLLTEDQLPYLQRARYARMRARVGGQEMMMVVAGGTGSADVSLLVLDLDLTPTTRRLVNDHLGSYESNVTDATRKLHASAMNMWLDIFDALEARGFTEVSMDEPETQMRMASEMQSIFQDVTKKSMKHSAEIRRLNRMAVDSVSKLLERKDRSTLRMKFLQKAYPELNMQLDPRVTALSDAILDDLDDATTRDSVEAIITQFEMHSDRFAKQGMDIVDEYRTAMGPMNFDADSMQEYQKRLMDLRKEFTESLADYQEQVAAVLGEDGVRKIQEVMVAASTTPAPAMKPATADTPIARFDEYVPQPISTAQLKRLLEPVQLDETSAEIVAELHRNYKERCADMQAEHIAPLRQTRRRMWGFNEVTGQQESPDPRAADELHTRRLAAIAAVLVADDQLFEEITLTIGNDANTTPIERARLARRRAIFDADPHSRMYAVGGDYVETPCDLTTVAGPVQLTAFLEGDALAEANNAMAEYERRLTELMHVRFNQSIEYQHAMDTWSVSTQARALAGDDPQITADWSARYAATLGPPMQALLATRQTINSINRETLDSLCGTLNENHALTLRDQYKRIAFASVFTDNRDLGALFDRALALDGLSARQREDLETLALEYRPAAREFADQLIEMIQSRPHAPMFGVEAEFDWRAYQDAQNRISKVTFDRDDLNHRIVRRLRVLLDDKQIARLGGLPTFDSDEQRRF